MRQTLYIHIGRPKVGSSSIQHFLQINRKELREQGCLYPQPGIFQSAHHRLSLTFLPNLPDHHIVEGIDSRDIYQTIIDDIQNEGLPKAIISSEHFWLVDPRQLSRILGNIFEVKIVCYVRRQDDVLVSSIVQEIKGGIIPLDFDFNEIAENKHRLQNLDYYQILERWAAAFGKENVSVRVLERARASGGIEKDIISVLGLDEGYRYQTAEFDRNASPAIDFLEFISEVNEFPVGHMAKRNLIAILSEVSQVVGFDKSTLDSKLLVSQQQRAQFLEKFAASNRKLAEKYLGIAVDELFPPLDNAAHASVQLGEIDIVRLRQLIAGILSYQQRQIFQLQSKVTKQDHRISLLEDVVKKMSEQQGKAPKDNKFLRLFTSGNNSD